MIKLKWTVAPPPTGRYRAFQGRSWPSAEFSDGSMAAQLHADSDYRGQYLRQQPLGFELTVRVVRRRDLGDTTSTGGWDWVILKQRATSIPHAKTLVDEFYARHPSNVPEALR